MGTINGRGVKVEVGITEGTALTLSAITLASPAVATTSVAHSLAAKSCGYLKDIVGMEDLEGQAIRVASPASTTFQLEGIDTSALGTFVSGKFVPISAWATLFESTSYQISDANPAQLDDSKLIDVITKIVAGVLSAQTVTIATKAQEVSGTAVAKIEAAAKTGTPLFFRITFLGGTAQRWFYGAAGIPGENVGQGQLGTGSMSVFPKGWVMKGAGA